MTGQIPFNQRKVEILKSIDDNDKSVKQSIDVHALPIVNLLNDMNQFVTTSSCSGRISIVAQPSDSNSSENNKMKKKASEWIYASHDLVDDSSSVIELMKLPSGSGQNFESVIYFKMEPFVLHVEADSVQNGEALLKIALQAGYRNSGLTLSKSRVMVGIRHTMKLDVPIGNITADGTRRLMVTDQYLEWLLQIANQKMQSNFARMQILYDAVANQLKLSEREIFAPDYRTQYKQFDASRAAFISEWMFNQNKAVPIQPTETLGRARGEQIFLLVYSYPYSQIPLQECLSLTHSQRVQSLVSTD